MTKTLDKEEATRGKRPEAASAEPGRWEHALRAVFINGWKPYAWICGIGLLLYARTLFFGYTSLDDIHLIVSNRALLGDWHNVGRAFAADVFWRSPGAYYRPLLALSLMADFLWGGINPLAYHLTNIVLHLACASLLYRLLRALGSGPWPGLWLALMFTAHPALTQAVAWVPGRNDTLMTACALLAMISLIGFSATGKATWYWPHLCCVGLGLFAKETFLLFPAVMLAYLLAVRRERWRSHRMLALVPAWLILVLLYLALRHRVVEAGAGLAHYVSSDGGAVAIGLLSYVGKAIVPLDLSVLPVPADVHIGYGIATLAVLALALCWKNVTDRRTLCFGMAWFAALLLPAAFFNTGHVNFMEHRLYLPMAGLAVAFGQVRIVDHGGYRRVVAVIALLMLMGFGWQTVRHCGVFRDAGAFWQDAVTTSPHDYLSHRMLGRYYFEQGQSALAEGEYGRSLALNPGFATVHNDLGDIQLKAGDFAAAGRYYQRAIELNPDDPVFHGNLGLVRLSQGLLDQAAACFAAAVERDPARGEFHDDLGAVYLRQGAMEAAEREFVTALRLAPDDSQIHSHLAFLYYRLGQYDRAAEHYRRAVALGLAPDPAIAAIFRSLPQPADDRRNQDSPTR